MTVKTRRIGRFLRKRIADPPSAHYRMMTYIKKHRAADDAASELDYPEGASLEEQTFSENSLEEDCFVEPEEDDGFEDGMTAAMAAKIRSGSYRPRRSDPWEAHFLYQTLKELGRVK